MYGTEYKTLANVNSMSCGIISKISTIKYQKKTLKTIRSNTKQKRIKWYVYDTNIY